MCFGCGIEGWSGWKCFWLGVVGGGFAGGGLVWSCVEEKLGDGFLEV